MTAQTVSESKALQLRLNMLVPVSRPLAPVKAVMHKLGIDEDDVVYHCESGDFEFVFDMRSPGAKRADYRVYSGDGKDLEGVVRACIPQGNGPIHISELARWWTVSPTHLHNLLAAKLFAPVPGQKLKAKESPLLARESVVEFLKERRSFK